MIFGCGCCAVPLKFLMIFGAMMPFRARYTLLRLVFVLSVVTFLDRIYIAAAAPPLSCQAVHSIVAGDSLGELSETFFGSAYYGPAILLATNARSLETGYRFIAEPDHLPVGSNACIPSVSEADTLRSRYDTYLAAVYDIVFPTVADITDALVAIDPRSPAR